MRKTFIAMSAILLVMFTACGNGYDDSSVWKELNNVLNDITAIQSRVDELNSQIEALNKLVGGGAVTSITTNTEGNNILTYKDADNVEHSITLAAASDAVTVPMIGMSLSDGVYYWTQTLDGKTTFLLDTDKEKIPVAGRTPKLAIDANGYWTVNGRRIVDAAGKPVKAENKPSSLITAASIDADGNAVLTLGDGTQVTVATFTAFTFTVDVPVKNEITDRSQLMTIGYALSGAKAANAVVEIIREVSVSATVNAAASNITVLFPSDFEEGLIMVMATDGENTIIKPLYFSIPMGDVKGISTAADLLAFAQAVNNGSSLSRFKDDAGEVVLNNDIDLGGVTDWIPAGRPATDVVAANKSMTYTTDNCFDGVFNGNGHSIKNIEWVLNVSDGWLGYGLFGALKDGAVVKNLNMEGSITIKGDAPQGCAVGAVVGVLNGGKIVASTNRANIRFAGNDAFNYSVIIGGLVGVVARGTIGGTAAADGCNNYGSVSCAAIDNYANGANSGMHTGGICGLMQNNAENLVGFCTNNGAVSGPAGRSGGIMAVLSGGTVADCTNNALVCDDIENVFADRTDRYNLKRMGGLVGGSSGGVITRSTNNGNVLSPLGCRTGGFVGHNASAISFCTNTGAVLSDHIAIGTNYHGSGWACGYNGSSSNIVNCTMGGYVGDYSVYKDNPTSAPAAAHSTAVCHIISNYDPSLNGLNDKNDDFYEWTVVEQKQVGEGITYTHYSLVNTAQHVYVAELDWTNPNVEITTVISDDCMPNSNNNNRGNNGKNLRETCSETCVRRRAEGQDVKIGINTGFFDSQEGILRGLHIEAGRPEYVNSPDMRDNYTSHRPCFAVLKDRTVMFGKKDFKGYVQLGGTDYEYFTINDTTLMHTADYNRYPINLYTARLKHEPHPGITFNMSPKALFVVATNNASKQLNVNDGWVDATITAVVDGRSGTAIDIPYVTTNDMWVMQAVGAQADALAAAAKVGDAIRVKATVTLDGTVVGPIETLNSTMAHFMNAGVFDNSTAELYPMTVGGTNKDQTKVYLIAVDGRTSVSLGVTPYQMFRIGQKLGCYDLVRFDGGGSTTMWVYDSVAGSGRVMNQVCDSKGERSCMNYLHVRNKK